MRLPLRKRARMDPVVAKTKAIGSSNNETATKKPSSAAGISPNFMFCPCNNAMTADNKTDATPITNHDDTAQLAHRATLLLSSRRTEKLIAPTTHISINVGIKAPALFRTSLATQYPRTSTKVTRINIKYHFSFKNLMDWHQIIKSMSYLLPPYKHLFGGLQTDSGTMVKLLYGHSRTNLLHERQAAHFAGPAGSFLQAPQSRRSGISCHFSKIHFSASLGS